MFLFLSTKHAKITQQVLRWAKSKFSVRKMQSSGHKMTCENLCIFRSTFLCMQLHDDPIIQFCSVSDVPNKLN